MIRKFPALFLFLILISPTPAQNPGDAVFAGTNVYEVNIQFPQANYWDTLIYLYNLGTEAYIPANVTINGTSFPNTGVRLKGNSSFSHPNNKKSLRFSFDEFVSGQRWDGLKGVHLNNCYGDPSFLREKMYLDLCRDAGIAAPRANYANVKINDTLFAFYSLIEHVDKRFLGGRYGVNSGDLFKAVDAFEGLQAASDFRWYGAVADSYYTRYELKTDGSTTAYPQLITLLDSLNNSTSQLTALPSLINMEALYKAFSADALFSNLDAYRGSGRNFYFYFHPNTNKMEWIIWDVGLAFGCYNGGVSNQEQMNIMYAISSTHRPLFNKISQSVVLKNEYLRTLSGIFTNYFSSSRLFPKIDSITSVIRPYIYADMRKQYTNAQFETNILSDLNVPGVGGTSRIPGIKSFINLRQTSVQQQLQNLGIVYPLSVSPGDLVVNELMIKNDSIPDPSGEYDIWVELYNNTNRELQLEGFYLSNTTSEPKKWKFPSGIAVPAQGYLITWMDGDTLQTGVHAGFRMNESDEMMKLSNTDGSYLDSVRIPNQLSNVSYGRIPNGTGIFTYAIPTFQAPNIPYPVGVLSESVPDHFTVEQNFPNPFNPETTIRFTIPSTAQTRVAVYNVLGNEVAELLHTRLQAGTHTVTFHGSGLSSGVYFYRITAGTQSITKQMILLK